jgi:hypothetical protein
MSTYHSDNETKPNDPIITLENVLERTTPEELDQSGTRSAYQFEPDMFNLLSLNETDFYQDFEKNSSQMFKFELIHEFDELPLPCFTRLDSD